MASLVGTREQKQMSRPKEGGLLGWLKHPVLLSALLAVVTVALYYPAHHHPFVNYDDPDYVVENQNVQSGLNWATVEWAFSTRFASNWHPLTWLTHAAVCQFFGLNAGAHHDINLLLHVLNVVLLFWILLRAAGMAGRSFMVAALFALHPVNVESVVWVAELKTLLSTLFFFLALGAYGWYAQRPRPWRMAVVFVTFAFGLMAKPQIITFPFILLLWDYWPLGRLSTPWDAQAEATIPERLPQESLRRLLIEKVPLFFLSAASAVITMQVQHGARQWYPRSSRVGNAILAYGLYVKNAVWPSRLALLYPHPGSSLRWAQAILSGSVLLAITGWAIAHRKHRYLVVGWLWFLGALIPMLGIVQVGIQAMADRYAYIAFLGLFIMICWGVADFAQWKRLSPVVLPVTSILVLLALGGIARRQIGYWQTEEALWRHVLQVTSRNWMAEGQLGAELSKQRRAEEAVAHYKNALAINPHDTTSNMGLAMYDLVHGNLPDAIPHYKIVVEERPPAKTPILVSAYLGLAKAYIGLGDRPQSQEFLRKAKALNTQ